MNKNYLSLLVIMGVLITGTIPSQQLVFADSDELEVEIEIKNGLSKIKVEFDDDEYEFQLATSDIDEILEVKQNIRKLIFDNENEETIKAEALANGMTPLREAGIEKIEGGVTTIQEVIRSTVQE